MVSLFISHSSSDRGAAERLGEQLRAGLLPRLEHIKERWVLIPPVLPGQQPTRNLARSLSQAFSARGQERSLAELEKHFGSGPAALVELVGELAEISGGEPNVSS